jgi:hypothetical protein
LRVKEDAGKADMRGLAATLTNRNAWPNAQVLRAGLTTHTKPYGCRKVPSVFVSCQVLLAYCYFRVATLGKRKSKFYCILSI